MKRIGQGFIDGESLLQIAEWANFPGLHKRLIQVFQVISYDGDILSLIAFNPPGDSEEGLMKKNKGFDSSSQGFARLCMQ